MTVSLSLSAQNRVSIGKGASRELRRTGKVPAVIYGKGKKELHIAIGHKEIFHEYIKPGFMSHLIDINIEGKKHKVIAKEVQLHPVNDVIEHADFAFVSDKDIIKVKLNLNFINEDKCIGIKRGGILNIITREIELMCQASSIPASIDIDLSTLTVNETIHLHDITLPKGVSHAQHKGNPSIATIISNIETEEKTEEKSE